MDNHRYSDGKNSYQPNRYKAQLNHQRAMRATDSEEKITVRRRDDDYFISSRRLDDSKASGERPYQRRETENFDVYTESAVPRRSSQERTSSNRNSSYRQTPPPGRNGRGKKSGSNASKIIVIIVASLLILAMIIFTVVQISKSNSSDNPSEPEASSTAASETQAETQQETTAPAQTSDPASFVTPNPEDNKESGQHDNGFYVWNDAVYELFYGGEDTAKSYAEAVNRYAKELGSDIKTYTMVIPTHVEMGLPSRFIESGEVNSSSQAENIGAVYKNLDSGVTAINCYNELAQHCNEYIYFNTDHHWTGLGAYYAYSAFAKATNQEVLSLDTCTKKTIEGFSGTLLSCISQDLPTDTVEYWEFPYETSNDIYYESDGEPTELNVYYEGAEAGTLTYGVFIWGDQPLEVLHSDRNTGKKIAIVKESFGNALVPYFTYNYDEVHVIDFRYWEGNLKDYCSKNGITEVLFANGVMSANTSSQIDAMDTLF